MDEEVSGVVACCSFLGAPRAGTSPEGLIFSGVGGRRVGGKGACFLSLFAFDRVGVGVRIGGGGGGGTATFSCSDSESDVASVTKT